MRVKTVYGNYVEVKLPERSRWMLKYWKNKTPDYEVEVSFGIPPKTFHLPVKELVLDDEDTLSL